MRHESADWDGTVQQAGWPLCVGPFGLLLLFGLTLSVGQSAAMEAELLWVAKADMTMESAPMVADLDGDGSAEVLTAAYEHIIVVNGKGQLLWRFDTRGRYMTNLAILERAGGLPLIYAGDNSGLFTCLDGAGNVVWQAATAAISCAAPALADLSGDGTVVALQGDHAGMLTAFDALTGTVRWKQQLAGSCASPAIGDLDGDGVLEIVITTGAGQLFALGAAGDRRWQFTLGGTAPDWATASPILFGDSSGATRVAAASPQGRLFCLNGRGKVLWQRATRGPVAATLSAGDLDADGRADLFAVTQLGVLYRFDEDGDVRWEIDTQGRSLAPGAVIDFDGDGALEYALCTQRGNLLVLRSSGQIALDFQFDNRTINVTPAFGDIVPDRPGLEFAVTGGESGQIFCFGIPAPVDTPAPWRTYRGDNRLTGAWFELAQSSAARMTPANLHADRLLTGGDITFRISQPSGSRAARRAEVVCRRPDGSRQAALGRVTGHRGLLKMPVSIPVPGRYRFEWALTDDSGAPLVTGSRHMELAPYRNDQALAHRAVRALQRARGTAEIAPQDRGFQAALGQESLAIEAEAQALAVLQNGAAAAEVAENHALNARTAALNARARRALRLAKLAGSVAPDALRAQVLPFAGTTWENRAVDRQLPAARAIPLRIGRRCVAGEHESVSIKLLNLTAEPVSVAVSLTTGSDGPSVTVCEVKSVPTNQHTVAWDPIVPLRAGQLAIPSLATREVWLTLDLADVAPGTYPIHVAFGQGQPSEQVEITLQVLPFTMAEPGAMRLCCWAQYNQHAVQDLLDHGNNVFVTALPKAVVADSDAAALEIDFAPLDAFVTPLASRDVFLLLTGIPSLGVPIEDGAYVARLAAYLDQVMTRLADRGIAENHVGLYPHDEPGGHGWDTVNHYIAFARQGLKARPGLQFYVNGGGDLAMFQALSEVAAIWCPSFYMLPEDTPVMDFVRQSQKTLWSYDCAYCYARPVGANTKTINVVAQYRLAPIYGLHFGATGIGYWCYNVGPSMWDPIKDEHPLVYTNPDGTHTSCRRWEAVREGMEDARLLIALSERLADDTVAAETKAKIRHLLDVTVPELAGRTLDEVRLGVARYVLDASNHDGTVTALRREMLDCAALLAE